MGFDGSLIADCDDDCRPSEIVELTNGCICCTVADEFLPAMEALLARDPAPDHIVIETSGPGAAAAAGPRLRLAGRRAPGDRRWRRDGGRCGGGRRRALRAGPGGDQGRARRRSGDRPRRSDRGAVRGSASLRRSGRSSARPISCRRRRACRDRGAGRREARPGTGIVRGGVGAGRGAARHLRPLPRAT